MRLVIQRVSEASVKVNNKMVGQIKKGYMILIGIKQNDTKEIADFMVQKVAKLRIFEDLHEKMNLSLKEVDGEVLLVPQFTLYASCKGCNRPDFMNAAKPDYANELYEYFINKCKEEGLKTETGIFRADMKVSLINDGPVTIILDSEELK